MKMKEAPPTDLTAFETAAAAARDNATCALRLHVTLLGLDLRETQTSHPFTAQ